MARFARVALADIPYHITHRGNRKDRIFFRSRDYERYLDLLIEYSSRYDLRVWAYCLMPNHVHLVVCGSQRYSMARTVGNTHRAYARVINMRKGWTGHLWANRYYSSPLDDAYLWTAARYVELNPVRAGMVLDPISYRWSSAAANGGRRDDTVLHESRPFPGSVENWRQWLEEGLSEEQCERIRLRTKRGRPLGSLEFVRRLEAIVGRPLSPQKPGKRRNTGQTGPAPRGTSGSTNS
jgi:putative transposase